MPPRKTNKTKKEPWEWAFLLPWFRVLKGLVEAADEIRVDTSLLDIGRDPETDWLLQINWNEDLPDTDVKRQQALLLTGILADVDYAAWLKYLKVSSNVRIPRFMDLGNRQLLPKFRFVFSDYEDVWFNNRSSNQINEDGEEIGTCIEWEGNVEHLFGVEGFSNKFLKDHQQAMDLLHKHMIPLTAVHAPRIQLVVEIPSEDGLEFLQSMEKTMTNLHATPPGPGEPGFVLDSMPLDLMNLDVHQESVTITQRVIDVNIPIHNLMLPYEISDFVAWGSFVRALFGIWLAFTLFIKASSTSVESLTFKGYSVHANQVAAAEEIVQPENPWLIVLKTIKASATSVLSNQFQLKFPKARQSRLLETKAVTWRRTMHQSIFSMHSW